MILTDEQILLYNGDESQSVLKVIDISGDITPTLQSIGDTINRFFTSSIPPTLTSFALANNAGRVISYVDDEKILYYGDSDYTYNMIFSTLAGTTTVKYNNDINLMEMGFSQQPYIDYYYLIALKWTDPNVVGGDYYGIGICVVETSGSGGGSYALQCLYELPRDERHPDYYKETDPEGEPSNPDTYGGSYFTPYDNISVPDKPHNSVTFNTANHNYLIPRGTFTGFINPALWHSDFIKEIVSPTDNIMDCVVKAFTLPVLFDSAIDENGTIIGSEQILPAPFLVSEEWHDHICGEVEVENYSGQFFDNNITCAIYLPYVGTYSLDINDVIPKSGKYKIKVTYRIHFGTGDCYVFVTSTRPAYIDDVSKGERVILTATGNMATDVPLSGSSENWVLGGIKSVLNNTLSSIGSMNPLGVATGALSKIGESVEQPSTHHHSANNNINKGSIQYPYLIFNYPVEDVPSDKSYRNYKGVPSNIYVKLKDLTGYVEVDEMHADLPHCTAEEKNEIIRLLKQGVHIR